MFNLETAAIEAFTPLITLISAFAKAIALFMILSAIFALKNYAIQGDYSKFSPFKVLLTLAVATLMWHSDVFLLDWQETIFKEQSGFPSVNPLSHTTGSDGLISKTLERFNSAKRAIAIFLQVMGYFSFVRGLHIWYYTSMGHNNSTVWKGFWHLLGGVLMINMPLFFGGVIQFLDGLNPLHIKR